MSATRRWRGWCATPRAKPLWRAEGLFGPRQVEWLERVRDDLESHRAAMTWLIERGRATEASEIASGLTMFWIDPGVCSRRYPVV